MSNRLAAAAATKNRSAMSMGESPLTPDATIRPESAAVCRNFCRAVGAVLQLWSTARAGAPHAEARQVRTLSADLRPDADRAFAAHDRGARRQGADLCQARRRWRRGPMINSAASRTMGTYTLITRRQNDTMSSRNNLSSPSRLPILAPLRP